MFFNNTDKPFFQRTSTAITKANEIFIWCNYMELNFQKLK